ncbi:MAG: CusA/CzcA family heavy metal efflux RND transporter [Planctomycetota bacterium]|nr:MAG: CusA/CzcA family heavy metal efflux RND transporter [Planctomycetota bacterium]
MVASLIRWCLDNQFLVALATVALLVAGYYCLGNTPVDAIPDIGEKQVIVFADWPGRSPQDVEDQVTYPLTVSLQGTPGVKTIRSASGFGFSMIFVIFKDEIDYYWARSRVLERMNVATTKLPQNVVPVLGPDATALGQVYWYTLEAEGADLAQLRSLQDWYVRYQLQAVEGVSEVASVGGFVKQYQVDVHPDKLRAHRVALDEVYEAVHNSNIDVGAKVVEKNGLEFFVRGVGFIKSVRDVENIVIRQEGGTPIFVKNVATVQLGPDFRRGLLDKHGREAVGGVVVMRYGENPLSVIDRLKAKIAEIEPGLRITLADGEVVPVRIESFYDRTQIVHETMDTLKEALTEEALVAGAIVIIFLLHLRSSLSILPTLPLSVAMSFIVMYMLGVDSNIMSLAGLAIAIGDVADMGIIMTENIYRRLAAEPHRPHKEVVYEAAAEVGPAILTAVSNTIVSFIPVFLLADQEGKLFKPLAYTKTFAIAASVILALTLVPVLSYHLLKPTRLSRLTSLLLGIATGVAAAFAAHFLLMWGFERETHYSGWPTSFAIGIMVAAAVYRMGRERLLPLESNLVARGIAAVYRPTLSWVLAHKASFLTIPVALTLLGITIWQGFERIASPIASASRSVGLDVTATGAWQRLAATFPGIGREFMPPLDEGSLLYMPSLLPSASLSEVQEVIARQDEAIAQVPEVASVVGKAGRAESALDPAPIGMVETIILLKPEDEWRMVDDGKGGERRITKSEILAELQAKTAIPGVLPTWLQPIQTRIVMLQTGFRAMMGVKVFGSDVKEIERIGLQMEQILRKVPGATDVVADRIVGKPYIQYEIDREAMARYGVNIRDVQDVIEIGIGGENLTMSVEGRERYPIRVRYLRELRERFDDLERVLVPTSAGAHVPIGQLARITYTIGPQELKSEQGLLVGYVTLNTRDRDEISVVEEAEALLQAEKQRSDELIAAGRPEEATLVVPPGYYWKWSGQFESQQRATARLSIVVPLVLLTMFVLIYVGLGRWWLALVVFFGIVVSASGGMLMLYLWGVNLSVAVWVGFIALFGVVDDSSVVMLDFFERAFAKHEPQSIADIRATVMEASLKRVRPLLMSTATTVVGLMPIFLTQGRGSDVMQPMAIPSVGGMAVQLITLFIAPCVYCMVKEWQLARKSSKLEPAAKPMVSPQDGVSSAATSSDLP